MPRIGEHSKFKPKNVPTNIQTRDNDEDRSLQDGTVRSGRIGMNRTGIGGNSDPTSFYRRSADVKSVGGYKDTEEVRRKK